MNRFVLLVAMLLATSSATAQNRLPAPTGALGQVFDTLSALLIEATNEELTALTMPHRFHSVRFEFTNDPGASLLSTEVRPITGNQIDAVILVHTAFLQKITRTTTGSAMERDAEEQLIPSIAHELGHHAVEVLLHYTGSLPRLVDLHLRQRFRHGELSAHETELACDLFGTRIAYRVGAQRTRLQDVFTRLGNGHSDSPVDGAVRGYMSTHPHNHVRAPIIEAGQIFHEYSAHEEEIVLARRTRLHGLDWNEAATVLHTYVAQPVSDATPRIMAWVRASLRDLSHPTLPPGDWEEFDFRRLSDTDMGQLLQLIRESCDADLPGRLIWRAEMERRSSHLFEDPRVRLYLQTLIDSQRPVTKVFKNLSEWFPFDAVVSLLRRNYPFQLEVGFPNTLSWALWREWQNTFIPSPSRIIATLTHEAPWAIGLILLNYRTSHNIPRLPGLFQVRASQNSIEFRTQSGVPLELWLGQLLLAETLFPTVAVPDWNAIAAYLSRPIETVFQQAVDQAAHELGDPQTARHWRRVVAASTHTTKPLAFLNMTHLNQLPSQNANAFLTLLETRLLERGEPADLRQRIHQFRAGTSSAPALDWSALAHDIHRELEAHPTYALSSAWDAALRIQRQNLARRLGQPEDTRIPWETIPAQPWPTIIDGFFNGLREVPEPIRRRLAGAILLGLDPGFAIDRDHAAQLPIDALVNADSPLSEAEKRHVFELLLVGLNFRNAQEFVEWAVPQCATLMKIMSVFQFVAPTLRGAVNQASTLAQVQAVMSALPTIDPAILSRSTDYGRHANFERALGIQADPWGGLQELVVEKTLAIARASDATAVLEIARRMSQLDPTPATDRLFHWVETHLPESAREQAAMGVVSDRIADWGRYTFLIHSVSRSSTSLPVATRALTSGHFWSPAMSVRWTRWALAPDIRVLTRAYHADQMTRLLQRAEEWLPAGHEDSDAFLAEIGWQLAPNDLGIVNSIDRVRAELRVRASNDVTTRTLSAFAALVEKLEHEDRIFLMQFLSGQTSDRALLTRKVTAAGQKLWAHEMAAIGFMRTTSSEATTQAARTRLVHLVLHELERVRVGSRGERLVLFRMLMPGSGIDSNDALRQLFGISPVSLTGQEILAFINIHDFDHRSALWSLLLASVRVREGVAQSTELDYEAVASAFESVGYRIAQTIGILGLADAETNRRFLAMRDTSPPEDLGSILQRLDRIFGADRHRVRILRRAATGAMKTTFEAMFLADDGQWHRIALSVIRNGAAQTITNHVARGRQWLDQMRLLGAQIPYSLASALLDFIVESMPTETDARLERQKIADAQAILATMERNGEIPDSLRGRLLIPGPPAGFPDVPELLAVDWVAGAEPFHSISDQGRATYGPDLVRVLGTMMFRHGSGSADPHGANVLTSGTPFTAAFRIALIDFGQYVKIPIDRLPAMVRFIFALSRKSESEVLRYGMQLLRAPSPAPSTSGPTPAALRSALNRPNWIDSISALIEAFSESGHPLASDVAFGTFKAMMYWEKDLLKSAPLTAAIITESLMASGHAPMSARAYCVWQRTVNALRRRD